jgi:hypothetical protein
MSPLRLTDAQLTAVMHASRPLSPEKRVVLLVRIAGYLGQLGYSRVRNADVQDAVQRALRGLCHAPAARG